MNSRFYKVFGLLVCLAFALALAACGGGDSGGSSGTGGDDYLDISVCDPSNGPFSLAITNPWMPLSVGSVWTLEGGDVRLQITVLDDTEDVEGVTTRVVEEREWEDDELIEVSRNFFVQAPDGTVCYYGEDVDIYENGVLVSSGGAWRAGNGNSPGILMPANPTVGMRYQLEAAPGVAEDEALITAMGESYTVAAGAFSNTMATLEVNPLESDSSDIKRYAYGVGLILDEDVALTEYTLQ